MNFIGKKSAVFLRKTICCLYDLLERYSGGCGKDAGCGCRCRNTPAKTFCAGIMWYLFYELILDFSYNLCIIKVHGGNAMAVDVRPSSRFDDYSLIINSAADDHTPQ